MCLVWTSIVLHRISDHLIFFTAFEDNSHVPAGIYILFKNKRYISVIYIFYFKLIIMLIFRSGNKLPPLKPISMLSTSRSTKSVSLNNWS